MFLILPFIYGMFGWMNLPEAVAGSSFLLQGFCSDLFVGFTHHQDLASAFICGTSIDNIFAKEIFQQAGLIHLMVVSGSHLIFVSHLLNFLSQVLFPRHPRAAWIAVLGLVFYSVMTGFQPPVVRSLVGILIGRCSHFFRWGWSNHLVQCFASLLLLSLNPPWILSLSFYLSWFASTGLNWAPLFLPHRSSKDRRLRVRWQSAIFNHTITCLFIQLSLTFLNHSFSWLSFLTNLLIAPILGVILFPVLLFSLLIPGTQFFLDRGWSYLLGGLQNFVSWAQAEPISFNIQPPWLWLALIIAVHHLFRRTRYEETPL